MAAVATAARQYPAGQVTRGSQQRLNIPQPLSIANKRTSQASAGSGTSANSDGKRKVQVGPWRLGRTLGRGSSGMGILGWEVIDIRPCTSRQECQYRTTCRSQDRAKVGGSDGKEKGQHG